MKIKKIQLALIVLFNIIIVGLTFSQDSIGKKVHFGIYGSGKIYFRNSQHTYSNGTTTVYNGGNSYTSPNDVTDKYTTLSYKPSLGFFLQLNRCFFELEPSDINHYKQKQISNNNQEVILYKYFSIGCELRFTWVLLNPNKYFMAPYLRLAVQYIHIKQTNDPSTALERVDKSNLFSGFLGTGIQKNIGKNTFTRLGFSGNFLSKGNGQAFSVGSFKETEIAYVEITIGYAFKHNKN